MKHLSQSDAKSSMLNVLQVFKSTSTADVIQQYIDAQKFIKLDEIRTDTVFERNMNSLFDMIDDVDDLLLSDEDTHEQRTKRRLAFLTYATENVQILSKPRHETFKHKTYWVIMDLANIGVFDENKLQTIIQTLGLDTFQLFVL
jgi:hypothetical protein